VAEKVKLGDRVVVSGYATPRYGTYWRDCTREERFCFVDMDLTGRLRLRRRRVKKVEKTDVKRK
jgi:hypothetical protein